MATASQTAWALLAFVAAGQANGGGARRAAEYLCATQLDNGDWEERHYTGAGFPTDFMIRYHLYRLHFPLLALGRFRQGLKARAMKFPLRSTIQIGKYVAQQRRKGDSTRSS